MWNKQRVAGNIRDHADDTAGDQQAGAFRQQRRDFELNLQAENKQSQQNHSDEFDSGTEGVRCQERQHWMYGQRGAQQQNPQSGKEPAKDLGKHGVTVFLAVDVINRHLPDGSEWQQAQGIYGKADLVRKSVDAQITVTDKVHQNVSIGFVHQHRQKCGHHQWRAESQQLLCQQVSKLVRSARAHKDAEQDKRVNE